MFDKEVMFSPNIFHLRAELTGTGGLSTDFQMTPRGHYFFLRLILSKHYAVCFNSSFDKAGRNTTF